MKINNFKYVHPDLEVFKQNIISALDILATGKSFTEELKAVKAVFDLLETSADGLSKAEVSNRLSIYGPNRLPESGTQNHN